MIIHFRCCISHFRYDKTKRKRTAQDKWTEKYEWLHVEENIMFCKVCRAFPDLSDKTASLVKGVTSKFRKETLYYHNKSEKHQQCERKQKVIDKPDETPLATSFKKADTLNIPLYETLFNTAYYVAIHNESFLKYPELLDLLEKNNVQVSANYRTDKRCKEFIVCCADVLKDEVSEELRAARFFSILTDGSTDKGIREQELVFVRFVDENGNLKTKVADIVQLEHGHARGVRDGILKALQNVGIDSDDLLSKLIGINTDGASVNLGHKAGAVKLLIDSMNDTLDGEENCADYITVVHCVAHNLELAVCDAKKGCQYLEDFENVLKGIFKLYYYSPKRRRELYEIASTLDKELKHYGGIQQVRWVASQNRAVKAVLDNYEVTVIHLQEVASGRDENADKAKGYLKHLTSERFLTFLHFMVDWTQQLSEVSKLFQEKNCLISQVSTRVAELKQRFARMKVRRGKCLRKFVADREVIEERKFRGIEITEFQRGRGRQAQDTTERVNADIDAILTSTEFFLEERFIKHIGGEPHSLFNVFNFQSWPENNENNPEPFQTYGDEEIESLLGRYPARIISEEEKENAQEEWFDLKLYMTRNLQTYPTVAEGYERMLKSADTQHLQNIKVLVKIMLSISPTTAECERGFSKMNIIKSEKRTSMQYDSLASLIRIGCDGPTMEDFQAVPAVHKWLDESRGTRHTGGHKTPRPRNVRHHAESSDSDSVSD